MISMDAAGCILVEFNSAEWSQGSHPLERDHMRWGCCGSMVSPSTDPAGIDTVETLAELGFDYIELSLAHLTALPEAEFSQLARRVERSGIRCEACNNFFPPTIRLTGVDARLKAALDYAGLALDRAAHLGASVIVFGSSGAKNVPEGFARNSAWSQIVDLLRQLGPLAAQHGLTIALEPINRLESNLVNLAAEGLQLAREVHHPNIQLLIDFYHLTMEREDPDIILEAGAAIRHLHFASIPKRHFPSEMTPDCFRFFTRMRDVQYSGRCSIEAFTHDFTADARRALRLLRSMDQE
jgi:D-psicose/D-tagatose/L-ribulose 3-epimerase